MIESMATSVRPRRPTLSAGERIKLLRGLSGLSQLELAQLIQTTQRTVAKLEGGTFRPSAASLFRLIQLFSVTDHWLTSGALPVFNHCAVLFVLSYFPRPGRRIPTIQEILRDHLAAFFKDAEIREAWNPLNDLFIFQAQETWVFLSSGMFDDIVTQAADRAHVSIRRLPSMARGLLATPEGFPKVLRDLAPHLNIPTSRVDVLVDSVRGQTLQREAVQRVAAGPLRERIRALIAASGLSPQEVLLPLLGGAGGGTAEEG